MYFLFDVMSTLIYDPFFVDVPRAFGVSLKEFLKDKNRYAWIDFESGSIDEQEFARRFSPQPDDAFRMREAIFSGYRWIDGMQELLQILRAQGHSIATLSNYPSWYDVLNQRMCIDSFVDQHFVSYRIQARKPDAQIYHYVLQKIGVEANQAVFIDDREENVSAARSLGMSAFLFSSAETLQKEFEKEGYIPCQP